MNVKATAYHEAGHAVVAAALRRKVHSATIIPDADAHGRVHHETPLRGIPLDYDGSNRARLRAEEAIMISLGGGMAQRRAFPRSLRHWHTHGDFTTVTNISGSVCGSVEEENAFIKWLEARTRLILDLRWHEVERIADALIPTCTNPDSSGELLSRTSITKTFFVSKGWIVGVSPENDAG